MRVFLDTNVFLYAVGGPHSERDACRMLLRRVGDGTVEATVNTEVIQEILFVLTRRGHGREALKLAGDVASLFPELLSVTRADMIAACKLLGRHPKLSVRDAVHAATMLNAGLHIVVSVDPDFDWLPDIRRVAPSAF